MPERYLVQFTGAHGVGKTTLVNAVKDVLQQNDIPVTILESGVRDLINTGVIDDVTKSSNFEKQFIITADLVLRYFETILKQQTSVILSTRTPFDVLAYSKVWKIDSKSEYLLQYISRFAISVMEGRALFENPKILTFYIPPNSDIPFEEDGVRPGSQLQIEVDYIIRRALEGVYPHVTLNTSDLKTRVNIVMSHLNYSMGKGFHP